MDARKLRHPTDSWRVQRLLDRVLRGNRLGFKKHRVRAKEYLDIGCGLNVNETFIGLDYLWHPELDICCDVTKGIPLPDSSLKGIYTEHCIEHLELVDTYELFAEFIRVLRPGGTVRIIVPDAEIYARGYIAVRDGTSDKPLPYREHDGLDGIYTPVMSVNRIFKEWGHKFIYDFETLRAMLERRGFVDVVEESFRSGRDAIMLQDSDEHITESVYVEASKPS
jgi:predicted SAM-dependent methyltransferase